MGMKNWRRKGKGEHVKEGGEGHYTLLTNCYCLYHGRHFCYWLKPSASVLLSGTHCHIIVVLLNCSGL